MPSIVKIPLKQGKLELGFLFYVTVMLCLKFREILNFLCLFEQWQEQHDGISCKEFERWKRDNDSEFQAQGLAAHLKENGISMCF